MAEEMLSYSVSPVQGTGMSNFHDTMNGSISGPTRAHVPAHTLGCDFWDFSRVIR